MVVLESGAIDIAGAGVAIPASNNPVSPAAMRVFCIMRVSLGVSAPGRFYHDDSPPNEKFRQMSRTAA